MIELITNILELVLAVWDLLKALNEDKRKK